MQGYIKTFIKIIINLLGFGHLFDNDKDKDLTGIHHNII